MSRHRNVRNMNHADELYDEDDDYSYSYDDNYCISPGTVAQFTFNRDKDLKLATYMGDDETEDDQASSLHDSTSNLQNINKLTDIDRAKLNSCMEELKNILGETTSDNIMTECILRHNFNTETSLNELLNQTEAPKPQREPRERRNRSQGDEDDFLEFSLTKSHAPVSVPKNHIIPPLNNNTIKIKTGTPPQKSIDSLSQFLSKMSTQNDKNLQKNSDSKLQSGKLDLKNVQTIPVNQTSGSSLSDLANQRKDSGLSLSQLANEHKADMSLSELANQNTSTNQSQLSGLSLADLSTQHQNKPDSNPANHYTSLANLANQHTSSGASLADPANQQQLNKTENASSNQSNTYGSSLADLALHNSTPVGSLSQPSNIPTTNQNRTSVFSLAELANQHQSNQASSNGNGSKNMSLSDLANQHQKTAEVTNENKGTSKGTKLSLAEMAANHKSRVQNGSSSRDIPNIGSDQSNMSFGKPDINLCKLNKSNSSVHIPNMVTGFSLAELSQQKTGCGESSIKLGMKSDFAENSLPEISLTSLEIMKPSKSKKETSSAKKLKVVDRQSSETYFEETDYNESELFIEKSPSFSLDQTFIKSSSSLGKVLSMKYNLRSREKSPYWKAFQYSNQTMTTVVKRDIKLHVIKQFNFDTPSLDDIVKQRQKAAFT